MQIDKAHEVREGEALNWSNLESYLKSQIPNLNGNLDVKQFLGCLLYTSPSPRDRG